MSNLNKILIKTFSLKSDEVNKFLLLFFHSFFVGLFIALYFVQANSVFISHYGSEQLPYAYLLSGLFGYIISSLYSYFQQRIKSQYLFISALAFMLLITLVGRIAFSFTDEKYLSFFIFIWAWPFISLSGIESGGLAIKLLNLVQIKRLFGLINMGGVVASVLGYLFVPILIKHIGISYNLLYIAFGSLACAIAILYFIFKKFPENTVHSVSTKKESSITFRSLFKENYFKLIFISATLSMTVIYITDFGFLSAIKVQVGHIFTAEGSVAAYMALVFAGLKIGELIISFLSGRILIKYGVRTGLVALPIIITFIILITLVAGFTVGVISILFLALMTANKSLERIIRRGLDDPAFNILYQPLPQNLQLAVQAKVGIVMQFSIAFAGALLLLVSLILKTETGFNIQYFPVFFLPILLFWVITARRLYLAYKKKLRDILKESGEPKRPDTSKYQYGTEVLSKKLKKFNVKVVRLSATILTETNPWLLEPYVSSLIKEEDELVQKAVLKNIDPTWKERTGKLIETQFQNTKNQEIKELANRAMTYLDYSEIKKPGMKEIEKLAASNHQNDLLKLIKYLVKYSNELENRDKYIKNLFKSDDPVIKNSAIRLSVIIKSDLMTQEIVSLIKSPKYYHIATAAVLDIGEKTLFYLDQLFDETDDVEIKLKVVEIFAKMGSSAAKSLIVKHINYPIRDIQLAVIWALFYCKYQAQPDDEKIIKAKILKITEILLTILISINDIKSEKNTLKLFLALDQEKETNYELLFNLLSFLHDPRIINLIKKNITGKNTIYALELIDNFIQPDLKPYIVPIFDDISVFQKIKKLSQFFPHKRLSFSDRLRYLVTLDYDKISTWAVAMTLEMLERGHKSVINTEAKTESETFSDVKLWTTEETQKVLKLIKKSELPDEVFLCLFHTHELVYSTAAKIIYDENPQKCFEYLTNMRTEKQKLTDILKRNGVLLQDKVKLLRRYQMFFTIPDYLLVELAALITVHELSPGEIVGFYDNDKNNIIILIRGELIGENDKKLVFSKKAILTSGMNIDSDIDHLKATKTSVVLTADRYKYFNLLVDNTKILQHIFDSIHERDNN
jgi:AAA family ATP:ADP antiporter